MAVATKTAVVDDPQPVAKARKRPGKTEPATQKSSWVFTGMPPDADFWEWLTQFTPDEWANNMIAYLWRTDPITNLRQTGRATAVGKYAIKFDMDTIMRDHGSGGYRIDLCRTDPATGIQKRVAQHYFEILNMDHPPKVPHGDWLHYAGNEKWKWCEPLLKTRQAELESQAAHATHNATAAAPGPDPNSMFNTVLNGIRSLQGDRSDNQELASTVIELVSGNQQKMLELTNPTTQLNTLKSLIEMVKPPQDRSGDLIVQILRDELKATREELKDIRKEQAKAAAAPPAPQKSIIEEIIDNAPKIRELAGMLGFSRGNGTDWAGVALQVADKLADHVPMIVDTIRFKNGQSPNAGLGGWPASIGSKTRTQPAADTSTPNAAGNQPQPPAQDDKLPEQERQRLQAILNKYGPTIQAIAPHLIDKYKMETGYDLRDWFMNRHGEMTWTGLRDEVGAETLCALAQLHPQLKVALAPPEKLLLFLQEFFTNKGDEPPGTVVPDTQTEASN